MAFLEQLRVRVRIVEPPPLNAPVSRDADDDVVLATAVAAGASLIVTGDQELLVIRRHNGIGSLSTRLLEAPVVLIEQEASMMRAPLRRRQPRAAAASTHRAGRAPGKQHA